MSIDFVLMFCLQFVSLMLILDLNFQYEDSSSCKLFFIIQTFLKTDVILEISFLSANKSSQLASQHVLIFIP